MKTLKKSEKIVRWASEKKTRNMGHMITELKMKNEHAVRFMLNRLVRAGLIKFNIISKKVELHLTKTAYQGRAYLVNAR